MNPTAEPSRTPSPFGSGRAHTQLTPRDAAILDALTQRVKVLSVLQVARWFWGGEHGYRGAARRLGQLAAAGLVDVVGLLVGPEIELAGPLLTWQPGESAPYWGSLLRITRGRWMGPLTTARCVVATPRAAARYGCRARAPRISESTHDLHLSQIYLRLRAGHPRQAQRWQGEAQTQPQHGDEGAKVPDAIVRRPGRPLAIEVVGTSYGAAKLDAFHAYCSAEELAYELW